MNTSVEYNQSLKVKPGLNPNKDGPKFKFISRGKTDFKC